MFTCCRRKKSYFKLVPSEQEFVQYDEIDRRKKRTPLCFSADISSLRTRSVSAISDEPDQRDTLLTNRQTDADGLIADVLFDSEEDVFQSYDYQKVI